MCVELKYALHDHVIPKLSFITVSKEALEILHIDEYLMLDHFYITKYLREKIFSLAYLPFRILLCINIILQEYDIAFTVIFFHLMFTKLSRK